MEQIEHLAAICSQAPTYENYTRLFEAINDDGGFCSGCSFNEQTLQNPSPGYCQQRLRECKAEHYMKCPALFDLITDDIKKSDVQRSQLPGGTSI